MAKTSLFAVKKVILDIKWHHSTLNQKEDYTANCKQEGKFKINFSVITQVNYVIAHCLPAFQDIGEKKRSDSHK